MSELEILRQWKADALETLADNDRAYQAQADMLKEMHGVIGKVADALHAAQICLSGYVEIKNEHFQKTKKRKVPNVELRGGALLRRPSRT